MRDSSLSYRINYVIVIEIFLDPEGHENRISSSKVTVILLKGLILPICGVAQQVGFDKQFDFAPAGPVFFSFLFLLHVLGNSFFWKYYQ